MTHLLLAAFALAAPVPKVVASSPDWMEFRGPDGVGHYTGPAVPVTWGPDTNVAWKTPIPGKGWSSPILHKGKLYLTTAVPTSEDKKPDYELRAICVDAASGTIDWNELVKKRVIEDSLPNLPFLLVLDDDSTSFYCYNRNILGTTLLFQAKQEAKQWMLSDINTGSTWNLM
ncbi:MAG: hypothetical protein ACOVT5_06170, partial [Armatimonadaceae bacterium]